MKSILFSLSTGALFILASEKSVVVMKDQDTDSKNRILNSYLF